MKHLITVLITCLISISAYAQYGIGKEIREATSKYSQILYAIENLYIGDADIDKLLDEAIYSTIKELDPHSSYIPLDQVKAASEQLDGEFEGIGIEFAIINDTLIVQSTILGGPSEKVGLLPGDRIIEVDEKNIASVGLTNDQVFKCLRGKKGSRVNLKIVRRNEVLDFVVVRDKIPIHSVDASYFIEKGCYYIKLSRFALTSNDEIVEALQSADDEIESLILDLRGNSGGYLHTAIAIANQFLQKGNLIVYTTGSRTIRQDDFADGLGIFKEKPVVVLIDENSASASEIVAGAIQDWDRGLVVGRRSFGKGLVQRQINLIDGSQLRLTVAQYHTPSGRVIQSPYNEGDNNAYYRSHYERYLNGEMFSKDSVVFADSLKFSTCRKGRVVYGGGGIMPDIFVPSDTTTYSDYYASLLRSGAIIAFTNEYADNNRIKILNKYKTIERYIDNYEISDKFFASLQRYAKDQGIEPHNKDDVSKSKEDMCLYMKSLIASRVFSSSSYYQVINSKRKGAVERALEVIKNWEIYSEQIR